MIRNILRYSGPQCSFKGTEHRNFEDKNTFWRLAGQMQVEVEKRDEDFMKASSLREVKIS